MTVNLDEKLHNADWPKRTPDMPDWPAFLKGLTPAQRKTLPAAYLPARAALAGAAGEVDRHVGAADRDLGVDAYRLRVEVVARSVEVDQHHVHRAVA